MKSIYDYSSYRVYIAEYYQNEKCTRAAGFTYAEFANEAELGSPNYVKLIVNGSRNLTISNIHQMAYCMNLKGEELAYFETLVLEEQSKTARERSYYSARRTQLRELNSKNRISRSKSDQRIRGNERVPILLAALGRTLAQTIELCRSEYGYPETLVTKELQRLLAEGLLRTNEKDCFEQAQNDDTKHQMLSDKKASNLAQRQHIANGLIEANEVFRKRYELGTAKFLSIFLTADPGSLQQIFDELRQSVEKVGPRFEPALENSPGVYRIQLQFYRMKAET
jgi:hypothetical protein